MKKSVQTYDKDRMALTNAKGCLKDLKEKNDKNAYDERLTILKKAKTESEEMLRSQIALLEREHAEKETRERATSVDSTSMLRKARKESEERAAMLDTQNSVLGEKLIKAQKELKDRADKETINKGAILALSEEKRALEDTIHVLEKDNKFLENKMKSVENELKLSRAEAGGLTNEQVPSFLSLIYQPQSL